MVSDPMADVITGVAIKSSAGAMVSLPRPYRHHHIFALAAFMGIDLDDGQQGFTTEAGHFVSREAAFKMVIAHDQPNRRSGNSDSEELFSEDVW
jgi:hypothetical protein